MTQKKLDLLQIAASLAAELRAGPAQIVRSEPLDPISFAACSTTDHTAQSLTLSP